MQPPRGRADDLGKAAFDVHMDVFERARERKRPRLDFAFDLGETPSDRLGVGGFDDALAGEHGEMGLGAGDILGGELAVEIDRGVDLFHRLGRSPGEPAAPHCVAHARCLGSRRGPSYTGRLRRPARPRATAPPTRRSSRPGSRPSPRANWRRSRWRANLGGRYKSLSSAKTAASSRLPTFTAERCW